MGNGGLNVLTDLNMVFLFGIAAVISTVIETSNREYELDPLGLQGFSIAPFSEFLPKERQWMAEAEIKNGRLAMIAITAYAFQEFVSKVPVVLETPYLFGVST